MSKLCVICSAQDTNGENVAQSNLKFSCKSVFSASVLYSHTGPLRCRKGQSSQQRIRILGLAFSCKWIYMSLHFVEGTQSKNNISRPAGVETTSALERHTCVAIQSLVLQELVTDLPGSLLAGQTMKYVRLCTKKKRKKIHHYNRHAFYSLFTFVTVNQGSLLYSMKETVNAWVTLGENKRER